MSSDEEDDEPSLEWRQEEWEVQNRLDDDWDEKHGIDPITGEPIEDNN